MNTPSKFWMGSRLPSHICTRMQQALYVTRPLSFAMHLFIVVLYHYTLNTFYHQRPRTLVTFSVSVMIMGRFLPTAGNLMWASFFKVENNKDMHNTVQSK